jgi:hypothetical protein
MFKFLVKGADMDLKKQYDAARAASDKVQGILTEMQAAFDLGTEEGKQKALTLRPELDKAKAEADSANQLYISMRDASSGMDNAAKLFAPAGNGPQAGTGGTEAKEMTRKAFEDLDPSARMKFFKGGGKIVDAAQ